jgi:hypothetical protein
MVNDLATRGQVAGPCGGRDGGLRAITARPAVGRDDDACVGRSSKSAGPVARGGEGRCCINSTASVAVE